MATQPKKSKSKTPIYIGVAVAILIVVGVLAVLISGGKDKDNTPVAQSTEAGAVPANEFQAVTVTGTPLPQLGTTTPDPAIGTTIPNLAGFAANGAPRTIKPDGKPQLVLFLAHWCAHCNAELPRIVDAINKNQFFPGLEITGVATGSDQTRPNWPPSKWFVDKKFTKTTMADSQNADAMTAFGGASYPYLVLFDGAGTVLWRGEGEIDQNTLVQTINAKITSGSSAAASDSSVTIPAGESTPAS